MTEGFFFIRWAKLAYRHRLLIFALLRSSCKT